MTMKLTEEVAVVGEIKPILKTAGTLTTGWIPVANREKLMFIVQTGVGDGTCTVDFAVTQANTSAGGTPKAFSPAKSIATITPAASTGDVVALVDVRSPELDQANSYGWVLGTITVTGGSTGANVACTVIAQTRSRPAYLYNTTTVVAATDEALST